MILKELHVHLSTKSFALCLSVLALGVGSQALASHSTLGESVVGVTNSQISGYIGALGFDYRDDGSVATANSTSSYTGMNQNGDMQTMTFSGTTVSQSSYGGMHVNTVGSLTNNYYNAGNPIYWDSTDSSYHDGGSPDGFASLGFAIFNDTLQYGGALEAGYKARYIFHIDGSNTGSGALADLGVSVDGKDSLFFDDNLGNTNTTWATDDFDVNGITPQNINVQFSTQVVFNCADISDGANLDGQSNFGATATLVDIELVKPDGSYATGWTLSSESGTVYNTMQAVPEPGTLPALAGMFGTLCFIRRRKA